VRRSHRTERSPGHDSVLPESLPAGGADRHRSEVNDIAALTARNEHFIEACRRGSWEMLQLIVGEDFQYLDGRTGQEWDQARYVSDLRANPAPALTIDELRIHVVGDAAMVSARTASGAEHGRRNRYLDSYARRDGQWVCVHACVWPLPDVTHDMVAR